MRKSPLLCLIVALTAMLVGCANVHGTHTEDRPTQDRTLVSTHYEVVPAESPAKSSPLRLTFQKVEHYSVMHGGEKATVETYQSYKWYHELWEVLAGGPVLGLGLGFILFDGAEKMVASGFTMLNPFQNIGHGPMLERDLSTTPLPEFEEEDVVRTPVPDAKVQIALSGLPARTLETNAEGSVEVLLPHLITKPFRGLPKQVRARAASPAAGADAKTAKTEWVAASVALDRGTAKRLAAAAPSSLAVAAKSAPLGKVASGIFTLKSLGFETFADRHHERALSSSTGAPRCRLGEGSKGWVYASGGCQSGLAHGPGEAYSAAGDRRLKGEFVAGQLVRGREETTAGRTLSGEWKRFAMHGQGRHLDDDVLQYEGAFANGQRHGDGTCRFEGRYERCEYRDGARVDAVFVMREELRKSRAELAALQQEQKRLIQANAEEAQRVAAERAALERQRAEEARRRQAASQQSGGAGFAGALAMGLGGALLGGVMDVPADFAGDLVGAVVEDTVGGGNGSAIHRMTQKHTGMPAIPGLDEALRAASGSTAPSAPAAPAWSGGSTSAPSGGAASGGYQSDTIRVSCSNNPIPIQYKTAQCREAMIGFAQAYACNEIDSPERMQAIEQRCMEACGHRQCLQ